MLPRSCPEALSLSARVPGSLSRGSFRTLSVVRTLGTCAGEFTFTRQELPSVPLEWLQQLQVEARKSGQRSVSLAHSGTSGKRCQATPAWFFSFFVAGSQRCGSVQEVLRNFSLLTCEVTYSLVTTAKDEPHIRHWDGESGLRGKQKPTAFLRR